MQQTEINDWINIDNTEIVIDNQNTEDKDIVLERIESGQDISNGRLTIWSAGLKLWTQHPIFGVGDANIYNTNDDELAYPIDESVLNGSEIAWLKRIDGNMHNIFIQVLVCTGIVGFTIFITLAVFIVGRYIKFLYKGKNEYFSLQINSINFLYDCCFGYKRTG